MKFIKTLLLLLAGVALSAQADYTIIVPQEPGAGTDVWARIVAREWEKKLGEHIVVKNIPGANDIPGFNKFHNSLRSDPKVIMLAHGGNAESYLYQRVDYDYKYYDAIGLQNLVIMAGHRRDTDSYKDTVKFSFASGTNPDVTAMALLVCGPKPSLIEYQACYKEHIKYVTGQTSGERKASYLRGETNAIRETPAYYIKNIRPLDISTDWFNPGILDIRTGRIMPDPNFPGVDFQEVYKKHWGTSPTGELFRVWALMKNYRDVLQKSFWVDHGNPNRDRLVQSLRATIADPESRAIIEAETGHYDWITGDDVELARAELLKLTTKSDLKNLVWWVSNVLGQEAVYKEEIAQKAR
jgi:hypothetical protein